MDNVISIEIIIQHIRIQLNQLFKKNALKSHLINKFVELLLDNECYDFANKITILDLSNNKSTLQIIEDIVYGNRVLYAELFKNNLIDSLVKLLFKKFDPSKYPFVVLNDETNDVNMSDNCNNIIYFKSTIINNDDTEKIKKKLLSCKLNNERQNIYFVSLFISPCCIEKILNDNEKEMINFVSLFLTGVFSSFEEIFSFVLYDFSNNNLNKSFLEIISSIKKN